MSPDPDRPRPLRLLQQPLLHFLVLGGLLFLLHRAVDRPPRRIEVTRETLAGLQRDHQRRSGAPPGAAQTQALLEQYLDEEILYREALALQLDRGDVIIRRRLLQKMDFLAEAEAPEPSDADLQARLDREPARYALPARTSLRHVFLANQPGGAPAHDRAAALRARLLAAPADREGRSGPAVVDPAQRSADAWRTLGDPFVRGAELREHSDAALTTIFGEDFTRALAALPTAAPWSAPIASRYGLHLIQIDARLPPRPARLSEVREALRRDLREEQRAAARRAALARLRPRYDIRLPRSQP